ncbi:MAG: hypothetical protein AAF633_10305 [Chloroflexota bacterium]
MPKNTVKFLLWVVILGISGSAIFGTVYGIGSLITYFSSGADPSAALNIVPNEVPDWPVSVEWMADDLDTGREMEPFTRSQIESAYVRAWLQQDFSYTRGEPFGLKTYFTGPALAMVEENIMATSEQALNINQVATGHRLQLHYYSADGTVVAFTDREARVAYHVTDMDGNELMAKEEIAAYQVVMLVDDGLWKVRHWLRADINQHGRPRDRKPLEPNPSHPLAAVEPQSGSILLDGEPFEIHGINYYPQETPWLEMWKQYDGQVIDEDFALISSMGLNTIRIFVPFELFGKDDVTEAEHIQYLQLLRDVLNLAWEHDLRVIVTLFDLDGEYGLLGWPEADRHIEGIVSTFKTHPAILAWDIKSQPDLDYGHAGEELVNSWLAHAIDVVRLYDPHHLVTIGWSSPEAAVVHADKVDFVSYQFNGHPDELLGRLAPLQAAAGPAKPLVLSQFGLSTWNSFFFPNGTTEEEQANYYAEMVNLIESNEIGGYLAWTLYDFPHVPSYVVGPLPWERNPQEKLGLIREDGTLKPAARFVTPREERIVPYELGLLDRIIRPFYITVVFSMMMATFLTIALTFYLWVTGRFGQWRKRLLQQQK